MAAALRSAGGGGIGEAVGEGAGVVQVDNGRWRQREIGGSDDDRFVAQHAEARQRGAQARGRVHLRSIGPERACDGRSRHWAVAQREKREQTLSFGCEGGERRIT